MHGQSAGQPGRAGKVPSVRSVLLYIWIGTGVNFTCSSYRFIGIIISLLLKEKKDINSGQCPNEMPKERVDLLNKKIKRF